MAAIAGIKKDMEFYKNLSNLLKVLKGIAVAQFHILERKIKSFEKFHQTVENMLGEIETSGIKNPFINPQTNCLGVIAVTSDSGLLGGLNTQIMNLAFKELNSAEKGELIIIGERGANYAQEENIPFTKFPGVKDEERFSLAFNLRDYVFNRVLEGKIGTVKILYPVALSLIHQRREIVSILPFGLAKKETAVEKLNLENFIVESSLEDIVEYLVFVWMGQKFYDIFWQAKLAELAARFMHLEESSHRLEDVDKKLKLKYFRTRHELTDMSMREIFSARMIHGN